MNPQKHTMSVLAQITSWISDRIIENLAKKHKIQTRSFSADSHVVAILYAHLAHSLSLNDICDSLRNHAGPLSRIRNCTPPSRNGCEVEVYIIPDEDKQKVLDALYPFNDQPSLDEERVDLHTGRSFKVRDYIVTREGNGNFLVTPYYAEKGGTVLDWMRPDDVEGQCHGGLVVSSGVIRG